MNENLFFKVIGNYDLLKHITSFQKGRKWYDIVDGDWCIRNNHWSILLKKTKLHFTEDILLFSCKNNNLRALEHLHVNANLKWGYTLMNVAVEHGHIKIVQWLHENNKQMCWISAIKIATMHNHLPVLQYLLECYKQDFSFAMETALDYGQYTIAHWLHTFHGLNYCSRVFVYNSGLALESLQELYSNIENPHSAYTWRAILLGAEYDGRIDILEWFYGTIVPYPNFNDTIFYRCDLKTIQWYCKNYPAKIKTCFIDGLACEGRLDIVKFLHKHFIVRCTYSAMDNAAACGHLPLVQWFHKHRKEGCTVNAIDNAAKNGHLEVVQWLYCNRKEGCTSNAVTMAMENKHFAVAKWLLLQGCSFNPFVTDFFVDCDDLELLILLHKRCSVRCTVIVNKAASRGNLIALKWLHYNCRGFTVTTMDNAAKGGHIETAQWLQCNIKEGCTKNAMHMACQNNQLTMVQWLYNNQNMQWGPECLGFAMVSGNLELVQWVYKHLLEKDFELYLSKPFTALKMKIVRWLHEECSIHFDARMIEQQTQMKNWDVVFYLLEIMTKEHPDR